MPSTGEQLCCLLLLSFRMNMRKETQRKRGRQPGTGVLKSNADSSQLLISGQTPCPGPGVGWEVRARGSEGKHGWESLAVGRPGLFGHQEQTGHCARTGALLAEGAMPGHLLRPRAGGGGWGVGTVPRNLAPLPWPDLEGTEAPCQPGACLTSAIWAPPLRFLPYECAFR